MLKLMQMKYPTFPMKMTTTQSEVRGTFQDFSQTAAGDMDNIMPEGH
jgi:hypothetical protein